MTAARRKPAKVYEVTDLLRGKIPAPVKTAKAKKLASQVNRAITKMRSR